MPRLAVTVLMLALLAGTATAFALTEALKLDRTPIARPKFGVSFSPVCDCRRERARLPVRFRSQQTVDAVIVDGDGNPIRSLETGTRHPRGRFVYVWDGRDDDGAVVPDGSYRLRLSFDSDRRTIELPNEIRVDTEPPSLQVQRVLQDPGRERLRPAGSSVRHGRGRRRESIATGGT